MLTVAPVSRHASATVLKTGSPKCSSPPRHGGHDFRAVIQALLRVECALLAGQSLANHFRIGVDQNAHAEVPANRTTFDAASVSPVAALIVSPLFASSPRPLS